MSRTITLPSGEKLRTQSKRRYIVVSEWIGRVDGVLHTTIERRSDYLNTALAAAAKLTDVVYVVDNTDGRTVATYNQRVRVS